MKYFFALVVAALLCSCEFSVPGADEKFGKQNFVSAISLIELHKVRYGQYPENLKELKFLGDWDNIWLSAVKYEKVANGYNLYLERGWIGTPNLVFPAEFKRGLGIRESNVKWSNE